jgi:glycosyltransferase involved in cell wall biosynthesis
LRAYYFSKAFARHFDDVRVLAEDAAERGLVRDDESRGVSRLKPMWGSWLLAALAWLVRVRLRGWTPKVILSSYGPSASHVIGFVASLLWPTAIWVGDYRDLWTTEDYYGRRRGVVDGVKRLMERALLARARLLLTVSPALAASLAAFHGKDVEVVYNGFEEEHSRPRDVPQTDGSPIRICYTGTVNPYRSPVEFLRRLERVAARAGVNWPGARVVFAGDIDVETRGALRPYVDSGLVELLGRVSRDQAYALQREADYCLLIEDPGATRMGVMTGKIFEYMGQEVPIIAIGVSPGCDMDKILRESGVCAYAGLVDERLDDFMHSMPIERGSERAPRREFIDMFSRDQQSRFAVSMVLRVMEGRE